MIADMVVWNFGIEGCESPEAMEGEVQEEGEMPDLVEVGIPAATEEEVQEEGEMLDLVEDGIPSMCLSLLSVYVIVIVLKFVFILYTFLVCR